MGPTCCALTPTPERPLNSARATANTKNARGRQGGAPSTSGQGPAPSAKPRPFDQRSQPSPSALPHAARSQSSRLSQAERERWARSCAGAKHRARRRIPQRSAQGYVAGGSTEAAGRSCTYRFSEHLPAAWSFRWHHVEEIRQEGRGVG